jgi:hypothetical protein
MIRQLHGIVQGKTIVLHEEPGIADGQQVEIIIKSVPTSMS